MVYLKTVAISILIVFLTVIVIAMQLIIFVPFTLVQIDIYKDLFEKQHFYGQIRQYSLKTLKDTLRFGDTGMGYLETALTDEFFEESIDQVLNDLHAYITGEESELPKIPLYKLKEEVYKVYDPKGTNNDKHKIVEYWFGSLPDDIRLSEIISAKQLLYLKYIMINMHPLIAIFIMIFLLITGIMVLFCCDIWQGILWSGTSIVSAAGIVFGIGLFIIWLGGYSQFSVSVANMLGGYGFHQISMANLLKALGQELGLRLNMIAVVFLACGGIMMLFTPVRDA